MRASRFRAAGATTSRSTGRTARSRSGRTASTARAELRPRLALGMGSTTTSASSKTRRCCSSRRAGSTGQPTASRRGAWDALFDQYGTRGRARLFPTAIVDYITLNNSKGPFADLNARKAIAWRIDRSRIASVFGRYGRTPQCSLLTPAVPGYKRCRVYPNTPDLPRARSLASGHLHDRINYWYTSSTSGPQIQQLVTAQLRAIGFDNIEHRPFSSGVFTALAGATTTTSLSSAGRPIS